MGDTWLFFLRFFFTETVGFIEPDVECTQNDKNTTVVRKGTSKYQK